jgi:hypothetical protein
LPNGGDSSTTVNLYTKGDDMKAVLMILALCVFGTVAYAQSDAENKADCWDDYKKFCSIVPQDKVQMIVECLKQNMDQLSAQCKKQIEKR